MEVVVITVQALNLTQLEQQVDQVAVEEHIILLLIQKQVEQVIHPLLVRHKAILVEMEVIKFQHIPQEAVVEEQVQLVLQLQQMEAQLQQQQVVQEVLVQLQILLVVQFKELEAVVVLQILQEEVELQELVVAEQEFKMVLVMMEQLIQVAVEVAQVITITLVVEVQE